MNILDQPSRLHLNHLRTQVVNSVPDSYRLLHREWMGVVPYYDWGARVGQLEVLMLGTEREVWVTMAMLTDFLKRLDGDSFFLIHNHPSGQLIASEADLSLTSALQREFPFRFLGHAIVSARGTHWIA